MFLFSIFSVLLSKDTSFWCSVVFAHIQNCSICLYEPFLRPHLLFWLGVLCTGKRRATVQKKEKDLLLIGQIFCGKISIFSKQILHHNSQRRKMCPHFGEAPLNNNAMTRIWNVFGMWFSFAVGGLTTCSAQKPIQPAIKSFTQF